MLFNSTGGNVITLAPGNTRGMEVSGFEIIGSTTGSGIVGNNNLAVNINNNNIHGGLNGVLLTNLTGTFAAGTQAMFLDNNIHDNLGSGVQVTNNGAPPFVPPLDVLVVGNTVSNNVGDGMKFIAEAGATIGGINRRYANVAASSETTPAITNANDLQQCEWRQRSGPGRERRNTRISTPPRFAVESRHSDHARQRTPSRRLASSTTPLLRIRSTVCTSAQ